MMNKLIQCLCFTNNDKSINAKLYQHLKPQNFDLIELKFRELVLDDLSKLNAQTPRSSIALGAKT